MHYQQVNQCLQHCCNPVDKYILSLLQHLEIRLTFSKVRSTFQKWLVIPAMHHTVPENSTAISLFIFLLLLSLARVASFKMIKEACVRLAAPRARRTSYPTRFWGQFSRGEIFDPSSSGWDKEKRQKKVKADIKAALLHSNKTGRATL